MVRNTFTDHEVNVLTQLQAVDSWTGHVFMSIGSVECDVSFVAAEFVKETGMLLVVYSEPSTLEGISAGQCTCASWQEYS